jgi:phosphoglucosamine mutase
LKSKTSDGKIDAPLATTGETRVKKLFGTDGIRGQANVYPISPDLVLKLGQAIGLFFKEKHPHPRILIGKDTRLSGYMLEQALASGICSVGVDAQFLGPLPTPGIAYLTRGLRASAGIVISASHNPYQDNGIKIFSANGYKLPDDAEERLETLLHDPGLGDSLPVDDAIGRAKRIDDAIGQYAVYLKEQFPKHLTLDGLRLVIDCANGASYKVAPKVFTELGAECFLLGVEPNGTNINDGCGALHPQRLAEKVKLYKADLGLAFDGDADRLVIVDEHGALVDGDEILAICGIQMMRQGKLRHGTVVSTVMSNMGLEIALGRVGAKVKRTKVGDRYVMEEMLKGDFNLGGEQSGHLIFRDSATTGDGILAALHVLEIVVGEQKSMSTLKGCMERLPQVLKNIRVHEKVPLDQLPSLGKLIEKMENKLGNTGRILFRYSGTESLARIMVEGQNTDEIEAMAAELTHETSQAIAKYKGST